MILRENEEVRRSTVFRDAIVAEFNMISSLAGEDHGNANLQNGGTRAAILEIGVPGFQPRVPKSSSGSSFIGYAERQS